MINKKNDRFLKSYLINSAKPLEDKKREDKHGTNAVWN